MTDRIACINPNCRRTAAQEKHPGSTWIICGKCWKAMPTRYRARWNSLKKRSRKLDRIFDKQKPAQPDRLAQWHTIDRFYRQSWDKLISSITQYFTTSEQPVGLEEFMKENGLG